MIRALVIVCSIAATAHAKPCELPAPASGTAIVELDLDHDGAKDSLVPTRCERETCTYDVYLARRCRHLGTLRASSGQARILPLTSSGVALISAVDNLDTNGLVVYAWTGVAFVVAYRGCAPDGLPGTNDVVCDDAFTNDGKQLCLDGHASASFDVDGDGAKDKFIGVSCPSALPCGNWLLLRRSGCFHARAIYTEGDVIRTSPASRGRPARFTVGKYDTTFE